MRRPALALIVIATVTLMLTLDTTIVNVALPTIRRDLGFDTASVEWVVTGVASAQSGIAAALVNSGQQIGGSVGIAVLGTVAAGAASPSIGEAHAFAVAAGVLAAATAFALSAIPSSRPGGAAAVATPPTAPQAPE